MAAARFSLLRCPDRRRREPRNRYDKRSQRFTERSNQEEICAPLRECLQTRRLTSFFGPQEKSKRQNCPRLSGFSTRKSLNSTRNSNLKLEFRLPSRRSVNCIFSLRPETNPLNATDSTKRSRESRASCARLRRSFRTLPSSSVRLRPLSRNTESGKPTSPTS